MAHRAWFQRRWILQEFLLAKDPHFWCGDLRLMLNSTKIVQRFLASNPRTDVIFSAFAASPFDNIFTGCDTSATLSAILSGAETKKQLCLSNLINRLNSAATRGVTDGRDYLYAILGLASRDTGPEFQDVLVADYSITVEELFIQFATTCILEPLILSILSLRGGSENALEIPTWVPDLANLAHGHQGPGIKFGQGFIVEDLQIVPPRQVIHRSLVLTSANLGHVEKITQWDAKDRPQHQDYLPVL